MDPNLKLIMDELKGIRSNFCDLQSSMTQRIDVVEKTLADRFASMDSAAKVFNDWKPHVDAAVDDIHQEMGVLRKSVHRMVLDGSLTTSACIFTNPLAVTARNIGQAPGCRPKWAPH